MRPLEIDDQTTLAHILGELKNTEEEGLEITGVPEQKTILDNSLNRGIIEKVAEAFKKKVSFPGFLEETVENLPEEENLGFVEGEDVVSKLPMEAVPTALAPQPPTQEVKKPTKLNLPSLPNIKILKNRFAVMALGVGVLVFLVIVGLFLLPSANIDLTLASKDKETSADIVGDPKAQTLKEEAKIVPATEATETKDGSDQIATSTKKTIGSAATGRVTITNQDTTPGGKQFLAASTTLTPVDNPNLTFRLNNDVSVPSNTLGNSGATVGVNVTANQVGPDSNLAANTLFKINGQNNSVFAKNDLAFSGGDSKQVTVATSSDRDGLKKKILDSLTKTVQTDLQAKNADSLVPEGAIDVKVTKETYTPSAVDAEATTLKATLTVVATATLVKKDDLKTILTKMLEKESSGFKVDSADVTAKLSEKETDGVVKINAKLSAHLFAKVDKDEVTKNLAGKSTSEAGDYLNSIDNVSGYKVTIKPSIFGILHLMPLSKNKITIILHNG